MGSVSPMPSGSHHSIDGHDCASATRPGRRSLDSRSACLPLAVAMLLSSVASAETRPSAGNLADLSLEQLSNIVVTSVSRREERWPTRRRRST